jgi:hypothetical protein
MLRMPSSQPENVTTHLKPYATHKEKSFQYSPHLSHPLIFGTPETDVFTEASNHGFACSGRIQYFEPIAVLYGDELV